SSPRPATAVTMRRPNTSSRSLAGQKHRVTPAINPRWGRAAIEPVLGHLKNDHRMGRSYLAPLKPTDHSCPRGHRPQLRSPRSDGAGSYCSSSRHSLPSASHPNSPENKYFAGRLIGLSYLSNEGPWPRGTDLKEPNGTALPFNCASGCSASWLD